MSSNSNLPSQFPFASGDAADAPSTLEKILTAVFLVCSLLIVAVVIYQVIMFVSKLLYAALYFLFIAALRR